MRVERDLGELAAAHRLLQHGGVCEMLHGHNWGVSIRVEGKVDASTGILVDFLLLEKLKEEVWKSMDHAVWLNAKDPLVPYLQQASPGNRVVVFDGEPTAEYAAQRIAEFVRPSLELPNVERITIRVTEMEGCSAEADLWVGVPC